MCLADQNSRPTAKDLLANKILELHDSPKNQLPITIISSIVNHPIRMKHGEIQISFLLKTLNSGPKEVSFVYNTLSDSPEGLAKEMVEVLNLDKGLIIKIAKGIEKKLANNLISSTYRPKINIFKFNTHIFEPKTAPVSEPFLPLLEMSHSVSEDINEKISGNTLIKHIQELLSKLYSVKLTGDSFSGKKTMMLIKKFQHQEGITPNGIANEELLKLLSQRIAFNS